MRQRSRTLCSRRDRPDNPLSQVFSRASGQRMFWQFRNVKTKVMFWNPNWLPGVGKLLPDPVEDWLASHWGWHLWIYAQKRHLEFTELKKTLRALRCRRSAGSCRGAPQLNWPVTCAASGPDAKSVPVRCSRIGGTWAMMVSTNFYIYAPTGCGLVASNCLNTYCRIPPLA
jgi:hypothetical protein